MSYCSNCGNKVDETMAFCPHCGASLKCATILSQAPLAQPSLNEKAEENVKQEKQEKNENPEKSEKQEKNEYGFVGYLMGGLILVTIGIFAVIDLTSSSLSPSQDLAAMLLIIGLIIIIGAVYMATRQVDFLRILKRFVSRLHN